MGFVSSLLRLIKSIFGLAEGGTDRATKNLITASPDMIRNQFQKTRNDWIKDYEEMKEAIAELKVIANQKVDEVTELEKKQSKYNQLMIGAIEQFKKTQDENLKTKYAQYAEMKEAVDKEILETKALIVSQEKLIDSYTLKLNELKINIDNLRQEEAKTIAEITSSRKIQSINNKLQGLTTDTQSRNLDAIREEAKKAKAISQISSKISGDDDNEQEKILLTSAKSSKFLDEFNKATAFDAIFVEEPKQISSVSSSGDKIDSLFS